MDTEEIFTNDEQQNHLQDQSSFKDRHKCLFDQLRQAEATNKNRITPTETPMELNETSTTNKRKRSEMKQFQGRESIFKKPEDPISKCLPVRSVPDYKKNPHKWIKYSLDDVNSEDMSERGNKTAALSFLRELDQRKKSETADLKIDDKPRFNTQVLIKQNGAEDEDKAGFKGSKFIMPEYVVGQKKPTKKSVERKADVRQSVKEIKLDHLQEYDDGD